MTASPSPAQRDPAWTGRVTWLLAAAVVLWPLLVVAEFKPWTLLAEDSLRPALRFIADFFPPRVDAQFLALVARETWRTVAMATAGITLALLLLAVLLQRWRPLRARQAGLAALVLLAARVLPTFSVNLISWAWDAPSSLPDRAVRL